MRRLFYLALLLIIFSNGCSATRTKMGEMFSTKGADMQEMVFDGQYHKVIDYFKMHYSYDSADNSTLSALCKAYFETKNYKEFAECSDVLLKKAKKNGERRTSAHKRLMAWYIAPFVTHYFTYEDTVTPVFTMRAMIHLDFGDYSAALLEAEKAVQYLRDSHTKHGHFLIEAYGVAGLSHALLGRRAEAESYIELINDVRSVLYEKELAKLRHIAIAKIYMALKDYVHAQEVIESFDIRNPIAILASFRGLDYMENIMAKQWHIKLPNAFMRIKACYETGDLKSAKKGYDKLLKVPLTQNFGGLYFVALYDRGTIALKDGDRTKAIELFKHSVEIIESQRSTINTEASKIGFVGDKQVVYRDLVAALVDTRQYGEAFAYAERAKARALVDMLASKKQFGNGRKSEPTQLTALLDGLDKAEQNAIIIDPTDSSQQQKTTRAIVVVQKQQQIYRADPELASLVSVTPPDVAEIQQLLPPDETLVEYFGSGDTLFAFIVSSNRIRGVKLDCKELNKDVEAFRRNITLSPEEIRGLTKTAVSVSLTPISGTNRLTRSGETLYKKLIHPFKSMIHTKHLTIVPHGALHYLPFNALNSGREYLIDRYNIRILPSASVMKFLKDRREGHAGNLIAFGNPDLGDRSFDLPGAQDEAIAITKDKPKSKVLLRNQATETAVKRYGDKFRYIHFATHGTFDAERPLSSGLLMSSDSENDGTLTVGELYDLHLPADLVTLSACETALGKVANGDDVVGFTRGFLYAGTSSIVSSLWKVDDEATSILMQEFYRSLKETDKRSALRNAQLKVKDTYNSHPYFWAAFQITGSVQ